jgi:hypothetical protein
VFAFGVLIVAGEVVCTTLLAVLPTRERVCAT